MPLDSRLFPVGVLLCATIFALPKSGLSQDEVVPAEHFNVQHRWTSTASGFVGSQGNAVNLTWSIVPDGTAITRTGNIATETNDPSDLISFLDALYPGGPGGNNLTLRPWFPVVQASFERWSELAGITFTYEPNDDGLTSGNGIDGTTTPAGQLGVRGDHRLGGHRLDGGNGVLAYNYYPPHGDMVIDTDETYFNIKDNNSRRLRNTLMHELGHGLGLGHVVSSNAAFLLEGSISTSFDGPQLDDILGAHRNYGDVFEKNGGNDTVGSATSLGFIGDSQSVSIGTDAGDTVVASTDIDFVSIDDNSDIDYFSFVVGSPSEVDLILTPMGPTYSIAPLTTNPSTPETLLNTSALSDLSLEIFDTDGTTSLGFANTGGLGASEVLNNVQLGTAGTYFVRIAGADDAPQFYQLDIGVVAVAVPEPWTISLALAAFVGIGLFALRRRRCRGKGPG